MNNRWSALLLPDAGLDYMSPAEVSSGSASSTGTGWRQVGQILLAWVIPTVAGIGFLFFFL